MSTKTATVLMSDLVSSTELVVAMGDSTAAAVFQGHLAGVRGLVEQHGGTLVKLMGDGALAWFDSTSAAIDCAAAIQRSSLREDRRLPAALQVRIGISAGEILLSDDDDIYGSAVIEAARLCAITPPGSILTTDVVLTLAGSRQTRPVRHLDPVQLKGFAQPVTPVEIEWRAGDQPHELPRPLERAARRGPCVGREEALAGLHDALDAVQRGDERVVLVAGEAGIGKSRLVAAFAEQAVGRGTPVAYGWCDPQFQSPYQPWVEVLGSLTSALAEEQLRVIDPDDDLSRLLAGMPSASPDAALNAPAVRQRLFDVVSRLLGAGGAPASVVVLDDAQWIDAASVSLLRSLVRSGRARHVLVVVCTRPAGLAAGHPLNDLVVDLGRGGDLQRIDLGGLDAAALAGILQERTGVLDPDLVDSLYRLTDGNPFLVGELLAHPQIRQSLSDGVLPSSVLVGVRQLVDQALADLPPLALHLALLAAVYGREFNLRAAAAVVGADVSAVAAAIDQATHAGLLVQHPDGAVAYSHEITRAAVYDQLSAVRRAELHWATGRALEARADAEPAMVAHHLCAGIGAGEPEHAVRAALDATDDAAARSAFEVAQSFAARAEQIVRTNLPDRADLLARALVAQAESARVMLDADVDVNATLLEASDIAQRLGLRDVMHRAAVAFIGHAWFGQADPALDVVADRALQMLSPDDPARAGVLATVGTARLLHGDVRGAEQAVDEAVAVAERVGTPDARYLAYSARGGLAHQRPDVAAFGADVSAALDAAAAFGSAPMLTVNRIRMIVYCIRIGDRLRLDLEHRTFLADTQAQDYAVFGRVLAGSLAMADGQWAQAEASAAALVAQVPAASPFHDVLLSHHAAALAGMRRFADAEARIAEVPDRQETLAVTLAARRAYLAAAQGRVAEAEHFLDDLLGARSPANFEYYLGSVLADLANLVLLTGADRHAAEVAARLAEFGGQFLVGGGVLAIWGPADDLRSRLLARLGEVDAAIDAARRAIALSQSFGASVFTVRAELHLAQLLLAHRADSERDMAVLLLRDAQRQAATHDPSAEADTVAQLLQSLS